MTPQFTLFADKQSTLVVLMVFLATATLAFTIMASLRVRGSVKRRAAGILDEAEGNGRGLRGSSLRAAEKLVTYAQRHYASAADAKDMKVLRRRLVLAGFFDPRAIAYFFLWRLGLAIAFTLLVLAFAPAEQGGARAWILAAAGGLLGYLAPSFYLDRRINSRRDEHRSGFPDVMDLLVVCADAGLSMEASLERVARELADSYPSLSANIHMANLEIRAGRTMTDALEHLADRLGLEEARSFSTLIQQSTELGSSITDALRVYSDDMRHKRLSRAEEKAYSLPAKLAVPMMICIFPVLFVVILLPVAVRLYTGSY
jgi:tight adherence protein C